MVYAVIVYVVMAAAGLGTSGVMTYVVMAYVVMACIDIGLFGIYSCLAAAGLDLGVVVQVVMAYVVMPAAGLDLGVVYFAVAWNGVVLSAARSKLVMVTTANACEWPRLCVGIADGNAYRAGVGDGGTDSDRLSESLPTVCRHVPSTCL